MTLLNGETLRYLVFGAMTVVLNVIVYRILAWKLDTLAANTIAFFNAVIFAYWANSRFVFQVRCTKKNFLKLMAMRIGTLFIDNGGMLLLLFWNWNDWFAKCAVNGVVIVINYLFSKYLIFRKIRRRGWNERYYLSRRVGYASVPDHQIDFQADTSHI